MFPALDVRSAILSLAVTNWQVHYFMIQFSGTEEEVEVAERIKVAKVGSVGRNQLLVHFPQNFRAT